MRAVEIAVAAAEAGEGRLLDEDGAAAVVAGEDAALAVAEQALADDEIALLQPNAGAVRVRHADILEDEALDPRAAPAQHERRLALAGHAVEHHRPRRARDIGHLALRLHRALAIGAGRDLDRAAAIADRRHRILQRAVGPAPLRHEEGAGGRLGRERRGRESEQKESGRESHALPLAQRGGQVERGRRLMGAVALGGTGPGPFVKRLSCVPLSAESGCR